MDVEDDLIITLQCKVITRLEETTKVKELKRSRVATKEEDNINVKVEGENVNEYTKTTKNGVDMLNIDEVIRIDIKDGNKGDV